MAFTLADAQIAEIRRLRDAGPENITTANPLGDYSHIYRYISEQLGASDEKNWFLGATQANSGQGAYSAMIRGYSKRQMELRGIGNLYTPELMQAASNRVATRALADILGENPNTSDHRNQGNGFWLFPTVSEIADNDAIGVGEVLFDSLPVGDTARSNNGGFNAGWAGTLLFTPLDSAQTWRLTQGGGVGLNSLDDAKNILYAYDALRVGLTDAFQGFVTGLYSDWPQVGTDTLIGGSTVVQGGLSDFLAIASQRLASLLPPSAQPLGQLIDRVGVNHVLDMLMGVNLGKPVFGLTTDANFVANANAYFSTLSANPALIQSLPFEVMPTSAAAMLAKAKTDVNARAALVALSSVSVQVAPSIAQDLDLYDPATGSGELTDQYLKDRARMLSWKMLYDSGAKDHNDTLPDYLNAALATALGGLAGAAGLGISLARLYNNKPYDQDWDSETIVGNYDFIDLGIVIDGDPLKLAIDGKDITFSDHQIVFGSINADALDGSGDRDNLYGMAGADTLTGFGGNDYLEGGANGNKCEAGNLLEEAATCALSRTSSTRRARRSGFLPGGRCSPDRYCAARAPRRPDTNARFPIPAPALPANSPEPCAARQGAGQTAFWDRVCA